MLKPIDAIRMIVVTAVLVVSGAVSGTALAREDAPKKVPEQLVLAQDQGKQSVLHVSPYRNGEVPRQVLMNPAGSGIARPDQDINDGSARTQSNSRVPRFAFYGK